MSKGGEDSSELIVYYPNQKAEAGFLSTCVIMFRNIVEGRELIWQMFKRDFFIHYRRSILGYMWVFLAPILGIITWVFMNYTGILNPGDMEMPYPVFVLLGSQMWGLFMGFLTSASGSLTMAGGLMKQIRFEHEVLLVKQAAMVLANFLMTLIIVFVVMLVFKVVPPWQAVFFPVVALPLFFLGAGVGLVVSVFSAVFVDASQIVARIVGLAMYLTPVIYTAEFEHPALKLVVKYNPLSYLISACRDILTTGTIANFPQYLVASGITLAVFLIGLRLFFVSEPLVAEKL
ncbi:MAG: ABC transporter permease [Candidatus Abyssubacteria bacterium]